MDFLGELLDNFDFLIPLAILIFSGLARRNEAEKKKRSAAGSEKKPIDERRREAPPPSSKKKGVFRQIWDEAVEEMRQEEEKEKREEAERRAARAKKKAQRRAQAQQKKAKQQTVAGMMEQLLEKAEKAPGSREQKPRYDKRRSTASPKTSDVPEYASFDEGYAAIMSGTRPDDDGKIQVTSVEDPFEREAMPGLFSEGNAPTAEDWRKAFVYSEIFGPPKARR